jgi:D-alanine transaminase
MTKISYVNGQYTDHVDASVSIDDRGYVFSDGVYDVALIKNGRYIDWPEHCERLQRSLDGLRINYRVSNDGLKAIVDVLLQKNGLSDAMLYLQITRGAAPRNHPFPSPEQEPALVMTVSQAKLPPATQYENGVAVITLPDLRWKRRDYKTISLLPNIMAKQEAMEAGAEEAILVEDDGFVTEGSATNFFIVNKYGALQTHPLNPRILGGITRMGVLKVARENGIKVLEAAFTKDEMNLAQEAFITSTTKHILPVSNIDGKNIGTGKPGDVTKKLIVFYKEYIAKQIEG